MNPNLERLVRLQRAESDLKHVDGDLEAIPQARGAMEALLADEGARLEGVRSALEACQKARRQHEASLQDLMAKLSKYKGQLMEVKTNKEYTAMLHEIEGAQRDIRSREDEILAEMERGEALATELKREEGLYKAVEERARTETKALEERAKRLGEQRKGLVTERDEIAGTIAEDARALFQRVAKLRGAAVAEARDGMCQLCHVKLRLQMYVELKRNDEIVQCPSCSRILYYEPPAPTVVSEP
jgi:predicted  nucleic acid-binding Zn-ribbon protein